MKSVTHPSTLHLSVEIKCCIDRLRPPGKTGSERQAVGDLGDDGILRLSQTFSLIALSKYYDCCLGLMLIKFSSVAVAIIATMPPRLSAICIASPSEMWSSVVWLANANRTPRQ